MKPAFFTSDIQETNLQRSEYISLEVNGSQAVVLAWAAEAVSEALVVGTLHKWASRQPVREEMHGRGVVYAVDLPTDPVTPVVVRKNSHGGLLRALTGDIFLNPTRAPLELATSLRLAAAGILTPEVVAYVIYPVGLFFARCDVMTRRLPDGKDLPAAWKEANRTERDSMLVAIARLLAALASVGAWHADLNLKNIYIGGNGADVTAYLLDVDRVTFPGGSAIATRNFTRLARSARKWRTRWELDFDEDSLTRLAALAEVKE